MHEISDEDQQRRNGNRSGQQKARQIPERGMKDPAGESFLILPLKGAIWIFICIIVVIAAFWGLRQFGII